MVYRWHDLSCYVIWTCWNKDNRNPIIAITVPTQGSIRPAAPACLVLKSSMSSVLFLTVCFNTEYSCSLSLTSDKYLSKCSRIIVTSRSCLSILSTSMPCFGSNSERGTKSADSSFLSDSNCAGISACFLAISSNLAF